MELIELKLVWRGWTSDRPNDRPKAGNRHRRSAGCLREYLTSTSLLIGETTPEWNEPWIFVTWTQRTSKIWNRFCVSVNNRDDFGLPKMKNKWNTVMLLEKYFFSILCFSHHTFFPYWSTLFSSFFLTNYIYIYIYIFRLLKQ